MNTLVRIQFLKDANDLSKYEVAAGVDIFLWNGRCAC
jgi:hypothetical protein